MRSMNCLWRSLAGAALAAISLAGCGREAAPAGDEPPGPAPEAKAAAARELVLFHAGSLSVPFKEVSDRFEKSHPGVRVLAEAAGSRDTARKVSDLKRPCDVLGSADYDVIDDLLIPDHASFNILFATNELGIAYTDASRHAGEITANNWHEILLRDDVAFGRADPDSDPCGYRTVMLFQLAEKHLGVEGLARRLEEKDGRRFIRPKETDLLALLEAREIDYLFIYESVSRQHGLKSVKLPDEINLESPDHAGLYATATVEVAGKRPGERTTLKGAPIVYAVTIPKGAPSQALAVEYLELLLSEEGNEIMRRNGQTPLVPARTAQLDALPASLTALCAPRDGI